MSSYKQKYWLQRKNAEKRGIEWGFTFESWMSWWGDDIVNRGVRSGQLVMARNGDIGPYHPDNVRKATTVENHNECHKGRVNKKGKQIKTPYGIFRNIRQAGIAINKSNMHYYIKTRPTEYYYL